MKIYKKNKKIIIEISYYQPINNCYDPDANKKFTHNVIGVIAGDEMTLSHLIDLSYKGDQQEGMPIVYYEGEKEDFKKLCKELDIAIYEHPICAYCQEAIRGAFTGGDKGHMCFSCESEHENKSKK